MVCVECVQVPIEHRPRPKLAEAGRTDALSPIFEAKQAIEATLLLEPVVRAIDEVASDRAAELLHESFTTVVSAVDIDEPNQSFAIANSTTINSVVALVTGAYRWVRRQLGNALIDTWRDFIKGATIAAGFGAVSSIVAFVQGHAPALSLFIEMMVTNPSVQQLLSFVLRSLGT